ncbi:MAG: RsmB/NOP family class I SAM-dependent RNA methyltransferase [Lachnospiraceae bacterium]|nr:RsmB/NOP family class I SAM-dependent RNA methyltransferase [Lachnospiraceae bacterium]
MEGFSLPESFIEKMREQLGEELDSFIACYEKPHRSGLRVNTLKIEPDAFEKIAPTKIEKIRWIPNGYYYNGTEQPAKHPYYYAGLYYIQEPSAMTPASLLPIKEGARVLDLCAAPGGKTTELGARLSGKGVLVTNDISNSRAKALLKNVELFGIKNAIVISEAPNKLAERFEGWFDSILVDAPCSGEGMFRKSHAIIKNWEQYGTGYYAGLQREILPSAIKMLRPGGYLLYSTCTFSTEEDEGTLKFILDNFPDMEIVPAISDDDPAYEGFCRGIPKYLDGREEAGYTLRIYPHKVEGEGHFIALLRKKAGNGSYDVDASNDRNDEIPGNDYENINRIAEEKADRSVNMLAEKDTDLSISRLAEKNADLFINRYDAKTRKNKKIPEQAWDFFESIGFEIKAEQLEVRDNRIYMMPSGMPDLKGLRILRSGLLMGEVRNDRFEPSQALACALRAEEYDNRIDLDADSPDVIKYLKCESIDVTQNAEDGSVLVCCGGFPLGWGKLAGKRLKNKYLPGWRMM